MAIVFALLKIIGIILLCLLGLIAAILLIILFVPVRYFLQFNFDREENVYHADFKITWLLRIFKAYIKYDNSSGVDYGAGILGKKIYPTEDTYDEEEEDIDLSDEGNYVPDEEILGLPEKQDVSETSKAEDVSEKKDVADGDAVVEENGETTSHEKESFEREETERAGAEDTFNEEQQLEKKSIFEKIVEKIKFFKNKIYSMLNNISHTIKSLCDKIKNAYGKAEYYKDLWELRSTQRAVEHIKSELGWLLRKLKPKRTLINICWGQEDPADTGKAYGFYCSFSPWIGDAVYFHPDFENVVLNGDGKVKGNIRIYVLALIALRVYRDRDIKKLLKGIRGHG